MRERQSIADREQNRFNRHDPNANINQMMYEDMVNQQRMMYYNLPPREYYQCTPSYELPHYCKAVPEHLENYYQQLLNYYKQSGYKPKECERLCCSLNNLKIKY